MLELFLGIFFFGLNNLDINVNKLSNMMLSPQLTLNSMFSSEQSLTDMRLLDRSSYIPVSKLYLLLIGVLLYMLVRWCLCSLTSHVAGY